MVAIYLVGLLILIIIIYLYHLSTKKFNYWEKRKVPYNKPVPVFGNYKEFILYKKHAAFVCDDMCKKYRDEPYFGTFFGTNPALVVLKPDIIKQVFVKDFYYFNSRSHMDFIQKESIFQNLFFYCGDKWRISRQNLTPLFSGAKLRNMFHLIKKSAYLLEDMLDYEMSISNVIEIKTLMVRYTMDCIGSCAFGIDCNTQDKNSTTNPFTAVGKDIIDLSWKRKISTITQLVWPNIFYGLGFKIFANSIYTFFYDLLTEVFENRQNKPSTRNDFVDLVLNWKLKKNIVGESITNLKTGGSEKVEQVADNDLLVSQCFLFFAAGFETSASVLSLAIYEMAKNREVQKRAQMEIDEYLASHGNKFTHDSINELPYISACISEVTRRYPIFGILTRETFEDYVFPNGLQVDKGTRIHLPVWHLHHNPDNFPEPFKFKPERFLPDAEHEIKPYTFFPFGEGPRTCIGARFAIMQIAPGFIAFLKKYSVELADGFPETLDYDLSNLNLFCTTPLRLKMTVRDGWEDRTFVKETV